MRTKNPRSRIVDELLAEVPLNETPDFKGIAEKVVERIPEGEEKDLKKILGLVRVRHYNFTKGGKVNTFRK